MSFNRDHHHFIFGRSGCDRWLASCQAAILVTIAAVLVSLSPVQASDITREVRDGSETIRSISLTPEDLVILRNLIPGQPLRFSCWLSFPLADAPNVVGLLERFIQLSDGPDQSEAIGKEFGRIGKTSLVLARSNADNAPAYVLRLLNDTRSISSIDARQLLKCIAMLPEMEVDRLQANSATEQ